MSESNGQAIDWTKPVQLLNESLGAAYEVEVGTAGKHRVVVYWLGSAKRLKAKVVDDTGRVNGSNNMRVINMPVPPPPGKDLAGEREDPAHPCDGVELRCKPHLDMAGVGAYVFVDGEHAGYVSDSAGFVQGCIDCDRQGPSDVLTIRVPRNWRHTPEHFAAFRDAVRQQRAAGQGEATPRYDHRCDKCNFLGGYDHDGKHYDLYHCTIMADRPQLVAVFDDCGSHYWSHREVSADEPAAPLFVAQERARARGLCRTPQQGEARDYSRAVTPFTFAADFDSYPVPAGGRYAVAGERGNA